MSTSSKFMRDLKEHIADTFERMGSHVAVIPFDTERFPPEQLLKEVANDDFCTMGMKLCKKGGNGEDEYLDKKLHVEINWEAGIFDVSWDSSKWLWGLEVTVNEVAM